MEKSCLPGLLYLVGGDRTAFLEAVEHCLLQIRCSRRRIQRDSTLGSLSGQRSRRIRLGRGSGRIFRSRAARRLRNQRFHDPDTRYSGTIRGPDRDRMCASPATPRRRMRSALKEVSGSPASSRFCTSCSAIVWGLGSVRCEKSTPLLCQKSGCWIWVTTVRSWGLK